MTGARILDGKATAATVRAEVRERAQGLAGRGRAPGLTVILVGDDPASHVYVRNKDKAAHEAGFTVRTLRLPATASQRDVEALVEAQNGDPAVHGILVQLPLPKGLDAERVIARIDPSKDVDGLTAHNVAALTLGRPGMRPCTPLGCIELLDRHGLALEGREVVVLGRSMLVGKPLAALALERNATVTIAHSRTRDLGAVCARADILVAAVGSPRLVQGAWVKPGAVVLDVGINRLPDGTLAGDVDFEPARERAAWITPVPGGVGPMTIAMLLANTLRSAERAATPSAAVL
ncbi:MAG: bifunctional methylenetetrahydrofolate dehydrogenase/methenyltetrahydrofolate cyclohydrolase FolD [Planctomycetota bacterium]|nr:bifunctional methylenetetrahydrofolate dehydrogenase/methenyltetrahydrofolate cyclohydrolase FolD [Planctomycetota bacterium]